MLKVPYVYTTFRSLLVLSKSPHPLWLCGSENYAEHFLSIVNHIDGFLGKPMFLHHTIQDNASVLCSIKSPSK
jgi:hypothetical protein